MRIDRGVLDVLFRRIPAEHLLKEIINPFYSLQTHEELSHQSVPKDIFAFYAQQALPHYSEDELYNIYERYNELIIKQQLPRTNFSLLVAYAKDVLTVDAVYPMCRFEQLLNWREQKLGEDLITTAYLAYEDIRQNLERDDFAWDACIETDNLQLKHLLNQEMSENHFHLHGSTQVFPLTWMQAMNHPSRIEPLNKKFQQYLAIELNHALEDGGDQWTRSLKSAALIRCYLYIKALNCLPDSFRNMQSILLALDQPALNGIDNSISVLRLLFGYRLPENGQILDYALINNLPSQNFGCNRALVGERYFMYHCFRMIFSGAWSTLECNLFYYYVLVKSRFRSEMVQCNNRVGFANFKRYQDRKDCLLINDKIMQTEALNLSINATFRSHHLGAFEVRVMPKTTSIEMKETIFNLDDMQSRAASSSKLNVFREERLPKELQRDVCVNKQPFYYTVHFPKEPFSLKDFGSPVLPTCRNHETRNKVQVMAKAISTSLGNYQSLRDRIRGIDACSNEIGCRPEVFATEMRYLSRHVPLSTYDQTFKQQRPTRLGITYHAGEDFLELVDGLRAIDEAITFLNMRRNDRLGHALALGIEVKEYYDGKYRKCVMPKQDLLDNGLWMLHKTKELNISLDPAVEMNITSRCESLAHEIYENAGYHTTLSQLTQAWRLRGDHPTLYRTGEYKYPAFVLPGYMEYKAQSGLDTLRQNKNTSLLYYAYHYDQKVKEAGNKQDVLVADEGYIRAVAILQEKMLFYVAKKGLGIETNPSSNYLIGTFHRYDKHPMLKFYNHSLERDPEKLRRSPQICISINTDDLGIFDTSLKREYNLMALALENCTDELGHPIYSQSEIYAWLDEIRRMGLQQSFIALDSPC